MITMEQKEGIISSQSLAMTAVAFGVLLIVWSLISGTSIFVAFGKGILIHNLNDVRTNIVRVVFDAVVPFIGGVILVVAGRRLMKIDRDLHHKSMVSISRRNVVQHKEHVLRVFLSEDEKRVVALIRMEPEGAVQSDLVIKTGYSKVKVHRILKSLENKEIIRRGRFGITNKVFLNKY